MHDQICAPYDAKRRGVLEGLCQQLIVEGGYEIDSRLTGRTLEALCDGLWLGLASSAVGLKERVSVPEAHKIVAAALASLFPWHFSHAA